MQPNSGWFPDPFGRFQVRYWDGQQWTGHVATGGAQAVDPPPPPPGVASVQAPLAPATPVGPPQPRRQSRRALKQQGRDEFETLAMRAALGEPEAVNGLPSAVQHARAHYRSGQFEKKRLEIAEAAIQETLDDDVVTSDEEAHLGAMLNALGLTTQKLAAERKDLYDRLIIARINDGRPPIAGNVSLFLKPGEAAYAAIPGVSLMKQQAVRQYRAGSSGVSIPLGGGVRYRTGATRGRMVVVGSEMVVEDSGTLTITSQRALFAGSKKTLEFRADRLADLQEYTDGLRLSVSNRQTASIFKLPKSVAPSVAAALITYAASNRSTMHSG